MYTIKKLPDICTIKTGKMDANHATTNGKYRFYTCASQYSFCNTKSFSGPSVIVPGNGDIGLVFFYDGEFEAYQRTYVLSDIKVFPKYLYYHLLYKWRFVNSGKQYGSTVRYVRMANFTNYEIPIPELSKQKEIVTRIEESLSQLDSAVETLKKTKQQLEVYRQAVLTEAFRFLSNQRSITDYFDISSGLTKNSKRNTFSTKMPYLRVANVYYDYLDLSEIKTIGVTENEIQQNLLKKEDILFVEGNGSKSQIGRVAIWDGSIENILHQNHIIKGRPNGKMLPQYALYYLMSNYGRNQILKVASSTSGLYTLSTNKIRNLQIPYCDLVTQQKTISIIEEKISLCKSIEKTVDQSLQQSEALRQSILKQAFEGE